MPIDINDVNFMSFDIDDDNSMLIDINDMSVDNNDDNSIDVVDFDYDGSDTSDDDSDDNNSDDNNEPDDCPDCGNSRTSFGWCKECETDAMRNNFNYWASGNSNIDKLIRTTQLDADRMCDYLEWIPFEQFELIKNYKRSKHASLYLATWLEGPRWAWDKNAQTWDRTGPIQVILKRLDGSLNILKSYIEKVI